MTDPDRPEPPSLTFGLADGSEKTVKLGQVGLGLRMAVGSLQVRSSIWRVTARDNDVYITAAGLGQSQKLSLHKSGVWRLAYLSEQHAEAAGSAGRAEFNHDPRVLDRWEEPEGANGWMHALTVWVPHGQLSPLPDEVENPRKPIAWLPAPEAGHEVGLHFAIVRPDEGWFTPTDMQIVDGFGLPNNRALIALTSCRPLESARAQWMQDLAIVGLAMSQGDQGQVWGDPFRVGLFGRTDEGNRYVQDLRAPSREVLEKVRRTGLTVSATYKPTTDAK